MSMLPTATQTPVTQATAIRPDAVINPDGSNSSDQPAWEQLNPCPVCGNTPHDAPEGVHFSGDPHYVFEHCWKCGYRPALNNAVSRDEMQRQFEAFQEFIRNGVGSHPTLEAPSDPGMIAQMQAQIEELQNQLSARNAPAPVNTAPAQSFTPNTNPNIPDPTPTPSVGDPPGSFTTPNPEENKGGNG